MLKGVKHYLLVHQRNLLNIQGSDITSNMITVQDNYVVTDDECCICLESSNLMKTFCCHNYIHHHCLVHTFTYSSINCPLCRSPIQNSIKFNPSSLQESLDADILSLISSLHLELMKIYHVCNNQLKFTLAKQNILQQFYQINMTAVSKICKKIDKHLHINIKPYFLNIVEKNKKTINFKYEENNCSFCTIV